MVCKLAKKINFLIFSVTLCVAQIAVSAPKKASKKEIPAAPKAIPVDTVRFDNLPLAQAEPPHDSEQLPAFGQAEDNYAVMPNNAALRSEYFRVPESVRHVREIARKESLLGSQNLLFDSIRASRMSLFVEQQKFYEDILKKHEADFANILLNKKSTELATALEALFKASPLTRDALIYFGLIRLHGIYGDFSAAPENLQKAQKIEKAFHEFSKETNKLSRLKNAVFIHTTAFQFSSEALIKIEGGDFGVELRRIGLDLLWDLRAKLLPTQAALLNQKLAEDLKTHVPYERVYIDTFKQGATGAKSPEFIAIWRYRGTGLPYRKELLGLGLMSSGERTGTPWALTGQKPGAQGNSPDGVWRIFGFDKYYKGGKFDQYDMRGMTLLSYGNEPAFTGRGFHLVFFSSPWGYPDSHGCFRVYTNRGEEAGLANMIWAAINPMQLNNVDVQDFTSQNMYFETPYVREIMRTLQDRVWVSNFSKFEEGYRFLGDATYSVQIRRQYENFEKVAGVTVLDAANKFLKKGGLQKIIGPAVTKKTKRGEDLMEFKSRQGLYWAYDEEVRKKLFEVDFSN